MCRIFGYLNLTSSINDHDFQNCVHSLNMLKHGGPDDSGSYHDNSDGIYLGHRRLAVLDLSELGHQPMLFGKYVIVYNGEIYNFKEIKQELLALGLTFDTETDTEVILKSFLTWKYDAVNKFRGMFAFAIWDVELKTLILCRDRLGVKPLYYYHKDGIFIFSSELKAITKYPGIDLTIDLNSVSRFLKVGYIKSPFSIYQHVKKVLPGHFLEIEHAEKFKTWPYWSLTNIETRKSKQSDEQIVEEAENLLVESCKYRMVADVPVGIFLSGGIDSSLITSILSEHHKLKTFTIGFEDQDFNEATYAKSVATYLNTDHNEWILNDNDFKNSLSSIYEIYDEPFGDSSAIPTYLVSKFARQQVTVALSADGGDEVFGGYDRYRITSSFNTKMKYMPSGIRKMIAGSLGKVDPKSIAQILGIVGLSSYQKGIDWRLPKLINGLSAENTFDFYEKSQSLISDDELRKLQKIDPINSFKEERHYFETDALISSLGKIDAASYLEGDILTKVDRATMAVALEGREPLLDHNLVEFGLSLPDIYKIRDGKNKWILREILKKRIPNKYIDRPKKGFSIPVQRWLRTILKQDLLDMSADSNFSKIFLFHQAHLQKKIVEFLNGKGNINPHFIWNLHMLHKWYLNNRA